MQNLNTIILLISVQIHYEKPPSSQPQRERKKNKEETKECFISLVSITTNVQVLLELGRRVQFYENMN